MNIRIEIAKAIHGPCGFPECKGWSEHDLPVADRVIATGIDLSPSPRQPRKPVHQPISHKLR